MHWLLLPHASVGVGPRPYPALTPAPTPSARSMMLFPPVGFSYPEMKQYCSQDEYVKCGVCVD